MKQFHVIIVGGGLGGLTLAQGLKKNGISCAVYEKDLSRADRLQGYRILLRDYGTDGLKTCLPAHLYQTIADTSSIKREGMVSMTTEKLSTLMAMKFRPRKNFFTGDFFAVSRIVLHRILTTGLDDIIHYGHRYETSETLSTGKVRVKFTNGDIAEGDLLVAADGINSSIRKHLLPESLGPSKFGVAGIVGKVFLDSPDEIMVDPVKRGVVVVCSTGGRGIFVAPQTYAPEAKEKITELFAGVVDGVTHEEQLPANVAGENNLILVGGNDGKKKLIDDARDYMFYGYVTKHAEKDLLLNNEGSFKDVSQQDLVTAVLKVLKENNWSPKLVEMVEKTEINTVGYWPLQVSPKITDLSSYTSSNITFLGDAIHAMPPTGGEGGNTALRDAALLMKHIITVSEADDVTAALNTEIRAYEKEMLKFSRRSVVKSYYFAHIMTIEGYILPYIVRGFMRIMNFFFGLFDTLGSV